MPDLSEDVKDVINEVAVLISGLKPETIPHTEWKAVPRSPSGYEWKPEKKEFEDWSAHVDELHQKAAVLPAVERLRNSLTAAFSPESAELDRVLRTLVAGVPYRRYDLDSFAGEVSRSIAHYVTTRKFVGRATAKLEGILVEKPHLVAKGITIRPPEDRDRIIVLPSEPSLMFVGSRQDHWPPDSILEIEVEADGPRLLQEMVEKALDVLLLTLMKPVCFRSYRMHGDFMARCALIGGTITPGQHRWSIPPIPVDERATQISRIWEAVSGGIRTRLHDPSKPPEISFDRFRRALTESIPIEQQLLYAVMGLESLFLESGVTMELKYRLSTRTALLMGSLGLDAVTAAREVGRAYNLRSKYVHGSVFSQKEKEEGARLTERILLYLRNSLLTFLTSPRDKDYMLPHLDAAGVTGDTKELAHIVMGTKELLS